MNFLQHVQLEWWQALIGVLLIMVSPLIKAFAVVIVAKFVQADIAKIALPLIFPSRGNRASAKGMREDPAKQR